MGLLLRGCDGGGAWANEISGAGPSLGDQLVVWAWSAAGRLDSIERTLDCWDLEAARSGCPGRDGLLDLQDAFADCRESIAGSLILADCLLREIAPGLSPRFCESAARHLLIREARLRERFVADWGRRVVAVRDGESVRTTVVRLAGADPGPVIETIPRDGEAGGTGAAIGWALTHLRLGGGILEVVIREPRAGGALIGAQPDPAGIEMGAADTIARLLDAGMRRIEPLPGFRLACHGLVDIGDIAPDIVVAMPYATDHNYFGTAFYPQAQCWLELGVARRLADAADALEAEGLRLQCWDCYRPLPVQWRMWTMVPDARYVASPRQGSHHNRGVAVDVTLVEPDGSAVPMPTAFDHFGPEAGAGYRGEGLSASVMHNRDLLRGAMEEAGFRGIATEWWHFYDPRGGEGNLALVWGPGNVSNE